MEQGGIALETSAFQTELVPIPEMPEATTLRLRGRVTTKEAPELRDYILGEISSMSATKLVLQLSGIKEIDTSGAAVLAEALKFGQNKGLRVLLCSPSPPVMNIFQLAGFEEVLGQCCNDPQETWRRLQA